MRTVPRLLLHALLVTWLSVTAGFVALHLVPGDPVDLMVERGARDAATRVALRARYGVDQPVTVQYLRFVRRTATGDLGVSLSTGAPVAPVLATALGRTLVLSGAGALGAMVVGALVGGVAAWQPHRRLVRGAHQLLLVGYAVPEFLLAIALLWLLAFRWRWFPVGGVEDPIIALTGSRWALWRDRLHHLALPALTLAVGWAAAFARQQHAAVTVAAHSPALRVARAKGVSAGGLLVRHLLRPTVTMPLRLVAVLAPTLVGGALVVETVFAWPGVGTLLVRAIQGRDYPVASAAMVATGGLVALLTLAMELLVRRLDPREGAHAGGTA